MTMNATEVRVWAKTVDAGEYLATYDDTVGEDSGSRCGYADSELAQIRSRLAERGLEIESDDRGLIVRATLAHSCDNR